MELRSPETSLARLLPGCPISQSPSWFARKTPDGSDPTVPPRLGSEGGRPVTGRYHRLKRVVLTLEGVSVAVCREATLRAERVSQICWAAIQVFSDVRVPSSLRIGRMSVSSRGECAERVWRPRARSESFPRHRPAFGTTGPGLLSQPLLPGLWALWGAGCMGFVGRRAGRPG